MELTVSTRTLLRVLVTVALFIFVVDLRKDLHTVLLELLISLFLAVALNPLVAAVERNTPLSRGPAAVLVFALTIIVVATFLIVIFTPLYNEVRELRRAPARLPPEGRELARVQAARPTLRHPREAEDGGALAALASPGDRERRARSRRHGRARPSSRPSRCSS